MIGKTCLLRTQLIAARCARAAGHQSVIENSTELTSTGMVPELKLRLMTPNIPLWHQSTDQSPFTNDPFWSIFWPGGQVLCRHILNFPSTVKGKRILDLGTGCGAGAISCLLAGCKTVEANDLDPLALSSVAVNARVNNCYPDGRLRLTSCNYLGTEESLETTGKRLASLFDMLILGDMHFDEELGDKISGLIEAFVTTASSCPELEGGWKKTALIGDAGRWYFMDQSKERRHSVLRCAAKYELTPDVKSQNNGLVHGFVYAVGR